MDSVIKELCDKYHLSYDDAVNIVNFIKNKNEEWLKSMGVGCSVCKFNKRNNPQAHCDGCGKDSPLPFCKDYWVSE